MNTDIEIKDSKIKLNQIIMNLSIIATATAMGNITNNEIVDKLCKEMESIYGVSKSL